MAPIFAPAAPPPCPADAFTAVERELWALHEGAVLPPCLDLRYAAQTAMQTARRMEVLIPELALLPEFDLGPVRRLQLYAAATLHAELMLDRDDRPPTDPARRPEVSSHDAMDCWLAPREIRARAYTLLVHAYDHCRRGVTFLRWCHGDLERFVPPLHPTRTTPALTHSPAERTSLEGAWLDDPIRSSARVDTITAH